jgi:hypothetical protein
MFAIIIARVRRREEALVADPALEYQPTGSDGMESPASLSAPAGTMRA